MNERIRQLAEQVVGPSRLHGGDFALMSNEQVEKFAELIVRECADQFRLAYTDEQYQRRIDKTILKHFGLYE